MLQILHDTQRLPAGHIYYLQSDQVGLEELAAWQLSAFCDGHPKFSAAKTIRLFDGIDTGELEQPILFMRPSAGELDGHIFTGGQMRVRLAQRFETIRNICERPAD